MPGLLIMNPSGADARDGENRKRTHDGKMVNGERTSRQDAPSANASSNLSGLNGAVSSVAGPPAMTTQQLAQLPPEIAHLSADNYDPLSKLLERVSQECFNDLNDVLNTMARLPVHPQANGVLTNGLAGHANGPQDNTEANKQKKLLLMKFAQNSRAKFIKLLVLAEWGKKSAVEISKVIDLFQWTRDQGQAMDALDFQVEQVKLLTAYARQMNPDIRTALETLSKGKAEWIPDMGFIPPERLSPEKALKLLRYMDTSLAIRLNVHEDLPRHLKKWRITSGRATFTVDSEFEMDLISFSEDASEQWLFIDLRLLFTPAPSIAVGTRFLASFKPQMDNILKQSGLTGCFDFLHGFVLTHKIAVLKSQAYQLARTSWSGSIKVEPVRRSLIVQYWIDRPGRKSWIEIGISSNKPKNGKISWRGPPVSSLSARWFRHGVEVDDADLNLDFTDLSLEQTLKRVISLHVKHFLQTTRDAISPSLTTRTSLSDTEPCDCTLELCLGKAENKTTLSLETVTGRYILRPCTSISSRAEQTINQARDPLATIGVTITQLLAQSLQDVIQRHALQLGWQPQPRFALKMDTIKHSTKLDVLQHALFWPSGWTTKWALAAIIDSSGETWWCIELGAKGTTITAAEQLKLDNTGPKPSISRASLSSVERLAVQQLAFSVNKRELEKENIPCSVSNELSFSPLQNALQGWVLHLRTSDLLAAKPGDEPWLDPYLRITYQGFKADYRNISHIASGTMVESVALDMQKLMSASPQSNFTFSENGNFAILLTTPFGQPIVSELKARLRDVDRLRSFTTTLQKRMMKLKSSSLQQVQFRYSQKLAATVCFGQEDGMVVKFEPDNPHNRIRTFLNDLINDKTPFSLPGADKTGLDRFCTTLMVTRPILSTLDELELGLKAPSSLKARAHHVGYYRLVYANPLCSFDVRLRTKDDKVYWHIEDNDKKHNDSKPSAERNQNQKRLDSVKSALSALFKERGQGWFGIRMGIIAEIDGIPQALRQLHQTVMGCAVKDGEQPFADNSTPSTGQDAGPGQGPPGNAPRPNTNARPNPPNARVNLPNVAANRGRNEVIELD